MKKFKFRLEKVLEYRRIIKNEKLRVLMDAHFELQRLEERYSLLEETQRNNSVAANSAVPVEQFVLVDAYGARLLEEIRSTEQEIVTAQAAVDSAMAAYVDASKDEKAIDLLKTKRRNEYLEQALKEETQFLDEVSVQRIGNQRFNASQGDSNEQ